MDTALGRIKHPGAHAKRVHRFEPIHVNVMDIVNLVGFQSRCLVSGLQAVVPPWLLTNIDFKQSLSSYLSIPWSIQILASYAANAGAGHVRLYGHIDVQTVDIFLRGCCRPPSAALFVIGYSL